MRRVKIQRKREIEQAGRDSSRAIVSSDFEPACGLVMHAATFHIALLAPEIPSNTGAIIRLCANTGAHLHLIEPLGFDLSEKSLKRAGLDYHELTTVQVHESLGDCLDSLAGARVFAFSKRAQRLYTRVAFEIGDILLFGCESAGLPQAVLEALPQDRCLRIPMARGRSLNLANAASVAVYEAWRQQGFVQAAQRSPGCGA